MTIPRSNKPRITNRDQVGAGLFGLLAILAFALLANVACGGGDSGSADPAVKQGKVVYDRLCATCHGKDAKGMKGLGKGLIANAFTKSVSDQELVDFIVGGRPATDPLNETGVDMPPKGGDPTLTTADIENVVAFLRTL